MELYAGIDLHSNNNVVAVCDAEGREVYRKRLRNELAVVAWALEPHRELVKGIVVESTYNWYWLVDGLMERGYKIHLANTSAIQKYSGPSYSSAPKGFSFSSENPSDTGHPASPPLWNTFSHKRLLRGRRISSEGYVIYSLHFP